MTTERESCPECRSGINYLSSPPMECGHCGGTGQVLDADEQAKLRAKLLLDLPGSGHDKSDIRSLLVIDGISGVQPNMTDAELAAKFYAERGIDVHPQSRSQDVAAKSKRLQELETEVALFEERKRLYGENYRLQRMIDGW